MAIEMALIAIALGQLAIGFIMQSKVLRAPEQQLPSIGRKLRRVGCVWLALLGLGVVPIVIFWRDSYVIPVNTLLLVSVGLIIEGKVLMNPDRKSYYAGQLKWACLIASGFAVALLVAALLVPVLTDW